MSRRALISAFLFTVMLVAALIAAAYHTAGVRDGPIFPGAAVEHILGAKCIETSDGVYMFSLPRDDLRVRIGNVTLSPAMALDSWVAFADTGDGWMMMGDLVLRPDEFPAAQDAIRREGLYVTAIHNTLVGESPQVYDLHVGGSGDPETMARALHAVLMAANFTIVPSDGRTGAMPQRLQDTGAIDRILGMNGTHEAGILQYRIPRAETITENGMKIPASMDVATVIKLQPLSNRSAALVGEFVLTSSEVQPVFDTLNENGITVTATHSHMLDERPRLFYLHVWAVGDADRLAHGLRLALDKTNSIRPH